MNQQELLAQLNRLGVHTEEALGRFMGNEALFLSFVRQLPEKLDFTRIRQGLETEDGDLFYMGVHNLKGLSGNLSIEPIHDCARAILVEFRTSGFKHKKKLLSLVAEAENESKAVAETIQQYLSEEGNP